MRWAYLRDPPSVGRAPCGRLGFGHLCRLQSSSCGLPTRAFNARDVEAAVELMLRPGELAERLERRLGSRPRGSWRVSPDYPLRPVGLPKHASGRSARLAVSRIS